MTARLLAALATLVVALAIPVAQLRLIATDVACCCPDPARCKCPSHDDPAAGDHAALRACQQTQTTLAAPAAPVFVAPPEVALVAVRTATELAIAPLPAPHAPPLPPRPAAPS